MKFAKAFLWLALVASSLGGCAYTNIRSPLDTGLERTELGTKKGTASNYSLLWLVAWGDASYAKAAENGDIKVMRHSDQELQQYLFGTFVKQTTIVYGD
jgi:hypothetical protein